MYDDPNDLDSFDPGLGLGDVQGGVDEGGEAAAAAPSQPAMAEAPAPAQPSFDPGLEGPSLAPEVAPLSATVAEPMADVNAPLANEIQGTGHLAGPSGVIPGGHQVVEPVAGPRDRVAENFGFVNPELTADPAAVAAAQQAIRDFYNEALAQYSIRGYATPAGYMSERGNSQSGWLDSTKALAAGSLAGGYRGMNWEPGVGWGFERAAAPPTVAATAGRPGAFSQEAIGAIPGQPQYPGFAAQVDVGRAPAARGGMSGETIGSIPGQPMWNPGWEYGERIFDDRLDRARGRR